MAQFQVPQFIETESKIVGPLSLKQFLYIAAAGLLSFMLFFILKTAVWFIITALMAIIAVSLAFVKYNGRPLVVMLKNVLSYAWQPRMYLWKREEATATMPKMPEIRKPAEGPVSKVKNLWLNLITKRQRPPGQ